MSRIGARAPGLDESGLVAEVRSALAPHLAAGAIGGLAVSGGADSVGLAHLASRARPDVRWVVVHVRHGLRDDAADAAAAAACAGHIAAVYDERPVAVDLRPRTGVEAAAREARYGGLHAAAAESGLAAVCLGHTADDRAETILLNLGRGSGLGGLGAMREVRRDGGVAFVRPLLRVRRADVRRWAAAAGLAWVEDPTNADPDLRRTRVRSEVLPALARLSGGPGDPVGLLCRLADLAAADADALEALAAAQVEAHVVSWGPVRAVRCEALAGLPEALARRTVRALLAAVRGAPPSAADVEGALALADGGACTVGGGVTVTRGQGWLAAAPPALSPLPERRLALPGVTALPELGVQVVADRRSGTPDGAALPPRAPGWSTGPAWVRLAVPAGAGVRPPRPGDRLRRLAGTAPVGRLLAAAGVPRPARDMVPLVVDADDEVVWVPGVAARAQASEDDGGLRIWLAPLTSAE